VPTFGSLFAGIGGLDLGLELAGWRCRWQVEVDLFCQRVLATHWPHVARYGDIRHFPLPDTERVDLICGGFPCQPVSIAGKRLAQADERWLWPEFARLVRALRPRLVLVENVPGLLGRGIGDVLGDLAACGYDAEWDCIPASAVGAPHRRDRVWIVAYTDEQRLEERRIYDEGRADISNAAGSSGCGEVADADKSGLEERQRQPSDARQKRTPFERDGEAEHERPVPDAGRTRHGLTQARVFAGRYGVESVGWWAAEPDMGRVAHGIPARVDRLRALGNAVVPQVAEWIGRRLMEILCE